MSRTKELDPIEDPVGTQREINKALAESVSMPAAEPPPDTLVRLPGGLVRGDQVITQAEVRELTGEHEEALARAIRAQPGHTLHFVNTLLDCGVVRFGTEDPVLTRQLLKDTLVGDRDALMMGIRRATYGDDIEITGWKCPECDNSTDLMVPATDIPVRELTQPAKEITFEVPLRRGRVAEVRLANGADQTAVFDDDKLTAAERDSILLQRCLLAIRDANGTRHITAGPAGGSIARGLSLPDRHAILREMVKRQPGPQFQELTLTHVDCGNEVPLLLGMADLFRDLVLV